MMKLLKIKNVIKQEHNLYIKDKGYIYNKFQIFPKNTEIKFRQERSDVNKKSLLKWSIILFLFSLLDYFILSQRINSNVTEIS